VFSHQHEEGWFTEYEGCDPGYLSLTIAFLARLRQLRPHLVPLEPLTNAGDFAAHFVHPDGSFGGEYGSRNTYNFFPHGFELLGHDLPRALDVSSRATAGLAKGLGPCTADDHIVGHHTWSYFLAWQHFVVGRPEPLPAPQGRHLFTGAQLLVERKGDTTLVAGLNKGGVFKVFRGDELVASDTGVSLQMAPDKKGGKARTAVSHLLGGCEWWEEDGRVVVTGRMGWAKQPSMTTFKLLVLRLIMLLGGRFHPDLVRRLLQRILIVGKDAAPFSFTRTLELTESGLQVIDEVDGDFAGVTNAGIGPDQTSIYVVMSRTYQPGQLAPWTDLTAKLPEGKGVLRLERSL
jgi:hypothetical protein